MKHPITNHGKTNMHVGTAVIRPGETRMVDDHLVPPNLRPQATPASSAPINPVAALIAGKAAEVIAALPALSDDDLAQALALESGSQKPRTTVLQAIDADKLRRAALGVTGEDELIGSLATLTNEQLDEAEVAELDGEPRGRVLDAIAAERQRRADAAA